MVGVWVLCSQACMEELAYAYTQSVKVCFRVFSYTRPTSKDHHGTDCQVDKTTVYESAQLFCTVCRAVDGRRARRNSMLAPSPVHAVGDVQYV